MDHGAIKGHYSTGKSVMTATDYIKGELILLVDEEDREIGTAEKLAAHQNNLLHRAFSVFIFRHLEQKELLLQQRAMSKYHSPLLWTNTCCSHPRPGEDILSAGKRRLHEELGIESSLINVGSFHYTAHFDNGLSENEIDHVLIGSVPAEIAIVPNLDEVHAYRWVTLGELNQELSSFPKRFTPWFQQALALALL